MSLEFQGKRKTGGTILNNFFKKKVAVNFPHLAKDRFKKVDKTQTGLAQRNSISKINKLLN
jgi:hypothetical protein